jgi:hypothetical protein
MATHRPRRVDGTDIELARGELVASVRDMAKRWVWPKTKVERFLAALKREGMLGTGTGTPFGTVYCVVRYDTYAIPWDTFRDTNRDTEQEENKIPPLVVPPQSKAAKPGRKTRLPPSWQPTDQHRERCSSKRLDCDHEAEKFRAHHEAKGSTMLVWDKAFTTWLLKAEEWAQPPGNGLSGTTVAIEGSAARIVR